MLRALIEGGSLTPGIDRIVGLEQVAEAIRGRLRGNIVIATTT